MTSRVRRIALLVLGALVATTCATRSDDRVEDLESPTLVYVYDGLGRLRAVADPERDMAVYSYDAVGNVLGVERHPSDELAVVEVVPRHATEGSEVVVWGSGFADDPNDNSVQLGGVEARVTAASPFSLTVVVPDGAASGPVAVGAAGAVATGAAELEIVESLVPVVEQFSPTTVAPGDEVRIQGEHFTGDPLLDMVVIGGSTYAAVTAASATELVVTVPPTAPTGRITVATPYGSARSADTLVVAPLGYPASEVGERTRVEIGSPETVDVSSGRVALVTFAGERGQRLDLELGEDGLGCAQLAVGLADPSGVTLVDPHATFLARTTHPPAWCSPAAGDDADGGLTLPATGRYTLTLAPSRDEGGPVDLTLRELAADADAARDDNAEPDDDDAAPDDDAEPGGGGGGGDPGDGGLVEPGDLVAGGGGVLDGVGWLPVDLGTGALVFEQTDLVVADDLLPLALARSHWPVVSGPSFGAATSDPAEFGLGAALEFDMELRPSSALQYVELILPGGLPIVFDRTTPGTDRDTVFEHSTTPTGFFGASIAWTGAGWDMRIAEGAVLEFAPDGPLRAVRDRNGNTTTIRRDGELDVFGGAAGNVASVHSPTGHWLAFDYDATDRIVAARDHLGAVVAYGYDGSGRLATVTYTPSGNAGGSGGFDLQYGYDDRGLLTSVIRGGQQVTIAYDAAGRVAEQRLADGAGFTFSYATETRPTEIEGVSVEAITRAEVTEPLGTLRRVDFAGSGHWASDTYAWGTAGEQVFTAERDPTTGFVTAQVDPDGVRTGYRYDEDGNVVSVTGAEGSEDEASTTFDYASAIFDLTAVDAPDGRRDMAYDEAGNLLRATSYAGIETRFRYDRHGRVTSVTDGLGAETTLDYELGHRVTVTDPAGNSTAEFYDAVGRLAARTDATGSTTTYTYDGFDRVRTVVDPLQGTTTLDYDAVGNLAAVTDAVGNRTAYGYDERGRVASRTDPAGAVEQFAYDAVGNVVSATDRRGIRSTYGYDESGRLRVAAYGVDDAGGAESTVRYGYDAAGRLAQVEDTTYGKVTFDYDDLDRLLRESTPNGTVSYAYDAAGRRASLALDDGPETVNRYDDSGYVASIAQGDVEVMATRDALGRVEHLDLPNEVRVDYRYDERSAVTRLDYAADGEAHGDFTYRYDPDGRRASVGGDLATAALPRVVGERTYGPGNTLSSASFDAAGNLVADGTNTYTWDARGRLVAVDGEIHAELTYDPFGRRTTKTVDGEVTAYTYDGWNILRTRTTNAAGTDSSTATYLVGPGLDEIYARVVDGETTTYLTDALGSVVGLVGNDGEIATRYSYDPFGNTTVHGEPDPNPFTYTGRELDETGLLYARARYYSPRHARFISQDPIGFAAGDPNLYAYASNNPTTLTDPTGLRPAQVVSLAACAAALTYAIKIYFDNWDELFAIYDTNGDGRITPDDSFIDGEFDQARSDLILVTLDRTHRENYAAVELAITICSIFLPGLSGMIGKGATSFGRAFQSRFPNLASRAATRFPNASARLGLSRAERFGTEAAAGRTVISGHGSYNPANGTFTVPEGTTLHTYAPHGASITNELGNAIETGGAGIPYRQSFGPGWEVPNYTVHPPTGLALKGNPITVERSTPLSDLVRPGMGDCHLAFCLSEPGHPLSDVVMRLLR